MSKIIWTEEEIDFLRTAYKQGWRLKEMACFLKRSVTAVNKAMQRFSVRTNEARIKRGSEDHSHAKQMLIRGFCASKNTVQEEIYFKNTTLSSSSESSEKRFLKSENFQNLMEVLISPSSYQEYEKSSVWERVKKHKVKSDKQFQKNNNGFLSSYPHPCIQQKRKQDFKNPENFVSFLEVMNWLRKKGFILEKAEECSVALNRYGDREVFYKIKLPCVFQPSLLALKTQVQIVILANKLRLKESLPLFHVTEVTQE